MDVATFLWGVTSSLAAAGLLYVATRGRNLLRLLGSSRELAYRLRQGGITRFHLSRSDYHTRKGGGSLRDYLARADHSIDIVSISLKVTNDEGNLVSLFQQRLFERDSFRIAISLLHPACVATDCVALSLDISPADLRAEINEMLSRLLAFRGSLPPTQQQRYHVYVHTCLPMGSAIMLDATPISGVIQVETKLYRTPRIDSFGYEVRGPCPFFHRNFLAWTQVIHESTEITSITAFASALAHSSSVVQALPEPRVATAPHSTASNAELETTVPSREQG